jgi:hypothetical protein
LTFPINSDTTHNSSIGDFFDHPVNALSNDASTKQCVCRFSPRFVRNYWYPLPPGKKRSLIVEKKTSLIVVVSNFVQLEDMPMNGSNPKATEVRFYNDEVRLCLLKGLADRSPGKSPKIGPYPLPFLFFPTIHWINSI